MRQVQRLWICQRLDGCGLDFHDEPAAFPLRLELFVGRPDIRLRLRCRGGGCVDIGPAAAAARPTQKRKKRASG